MPDEYDEILWITIIDNATNTVLECAAIVDDVDFTGGERGFENQPNCAGGRVVSKKPVSDKMITIKGWALGCQGATGAVVASPTGLSNFFHAPATIDTNDPTQVTPSGRVNDRAFTLFFLNTTDTTIATAAGVGKSQSAIASGKYAHRLKYKNAQFEELTESWSDKKKTFSASFRIPFTDKDGTVNWYEESCVGGGSLASLAST